MPAANTMSDAPQKTTSKPAETGSGNSNDAAEVGRPRTAKEVACGVGH